MEETEAEHVVIASGGKEKERLITVVTVSFTGKRLGQMHKFINDQKYIIYEY